MILGLYTTSLTDYIDTGLKIIVFEESAFKEIWGPKSWFRTLAWLVSYSLCDFRQMVWSL